MSLTDFSQSKKSPHHHRIRDVAIAVLLLVVGSYFRIGIRRRRFFSHLLPLFIKSHCFALPNGLLPHWRGVAPASFRIGMRRRRFFPRISCSHHVKSHCFALPNGLLPHWKLRVWLLIPHWHAPQAIFFPHLPLPPRKIALQDHKEIDYRIARAVSGGFSHTNRKCGLPP